MSQREFHIPQITEAQVTHLSPIQIMLTQILDIQNRDSKAHADRVTQLALQLSRQMGLSLAELKAIALGGRLHDVGKLMIPDYIVNKPGPLDDEERKIIQQHPIKGVQLLAGVKKSYNISDLALKVILHHHEKFDGTGYPERLRGEEIPLVARIFAVADVYDALTSVRPYKAAWETTIAKAEIAALSGTHFDPEVVNYFFELDVIN
jgi:HD-GYP domain-containing protein (c-di-GMP phosphodiesterase class II)